MMIESPIHNLENEGCFGSERSDVARLAVWILIKIPSLRSPSMRTQTKHFPNR
jgi:hypothetical protein